MKRATFWLPLAAAALGVLYFAGSMRPASDPRGEMQLSRFGKLPVLDGGRLKPVDTFARIQLMAINRRQTYYDEKGDQQEAVRWLLNLMAEGYPRFGLLAPVSVRDTGVQEWLGLGPRTDGAYPLLEVYTAIRKRGNDVADLADKPGRTPVETGVLDVALRVKKNMDALEQLAEQVAEARKKEGSAQKARVFRIDNDQVLAMLQLEPREGYRYALEEFVGKDSKGKDHSQTFAGLRRKAEQARSRPSRERDIVDVKALELDGHVRTHFGLMRLDGLKLVPGQSDDLEDWKTLGQALVDGDEEKNPAARSLEKIVRAYAVGDTREFNREVEAYQETMNRRMPAAMSKLRLEAWFNHFAPFYRCANLYVLVLLLAVLSWVVWREPLRRAAFWLAVVVVVVHTSALLLRMYLTGRPPVTNLYSSAVFIGWGCCLLCLVVEGIYRNSLALVPASVLGFATMIIAHHLGGSGDTMEVMQAVLDTNFWLATHVTTVTLGYTATFVAGLFAAVFIFLMLATAVRKYFTDPVAPSGFEAVLFVLSVLGWLAIPGLLILAVMCGLWLLWSGPETLTLGVVLALAAPLALAGGLYGLLVVLRRYVEVGDGEGRSAAVLGGMARKVMRRGEVRQVPAGVVPPLIGIVDHLALTQESSKVLSGMVYGVVCFATLLSFVGTVLGGIWADQSWGRFWGWDPKENGALLIVVMNALILHARWGGMIRERGLSALAIVGNMVTAWSWFGTNQLGVGLHAYGFNNTLAAGCTIFWATQLVLVGLACMPLRLWRAYADKPLVVVPAAVPPGPRLGSGRTSTGIQPA